MANFWKNPKDYTTLLREYDRHCDSIRLLEFCLQILRVELVDAIEAAKANPRFQALCPEGKAMWDKYERESSPREALERILELILASADPAWATFNDGELNGNPYALLEPYDEICEAIRVLEGLRDGPMRHAPTILRGHLREWPSPPGKNL